MLEQRVAMKDGAKLFTRLMGSSADRIPIIALHGGPGLASHADAEAAWGFLADRYPVLVFDARGNGVSDSKPPLSVEQWVGDIDALREFFGWDRIVLAAHSYAGYIALDYALAHIEKLAALMLVNTSASCAINQAWANSLVANADRVVDRGRLHRLVNGETRDDEDLWSAVQEYSALTNPAHGPGAKNTVRPPHLDFRTHNAAFSKECRCHDTRALLHKVSCPTLICASTRDRRLHFSELMARQLPLADIVLFEHSGHTPPLEEAVLFQTTVGAFLDRAVGRAQGLS